MNGKGKKRSGSRIIKVDQVARVEGEGGVTLRVKDGRLHSVALAIFEPPRYFEALLRGRKFGEAPDITSRICGICPVAYQMSSCRALESACGTVLPPELWALRRLLYCGEWIESHTLHIYMLHAPDFLGFENAMEMAKKFPREVERGLKLKKCGNEIMRVLGGREIHPVNVKVGGFYRVPEAAELATLRAHVSEAVHLARETVAWTAAFDFPEYDGDHELVAMRNGREYPMNDGRIVSTAGLDIAVEDFDAHFSEEQVPYSTALHCRLQGRKYLVGPLARFALNFDLLGGEARAAARAAGVDARVRNPYRSIVVRSIEVLQACEDAERILSAYVKPAEPAVPVVPRAAVGFGCTEAPRGILYHRYRIAEGGLIADARIVPPTSQSQAPIEDDIMRTVAALLARPRAEIKAHCERVIRSFDPCISCSAHFLKLEIEEA